MERPQEINIPPDGSVDAEILAQKINAETERAYNNAAKLEADKAEARIAVENNALAEEVRNADGSVNQTLLTLVMLRELTALKGVVTPPAPASTSTDPAARTFDWVYVPGIENVSDYEISKNDGEYSVAEERPLTINEDESAPVGSLTSRVRAKFGRLASAPVSNTVAIMARTPVSLVISESVSTLAEGAVQSFTAEVAYNIGEPRDVTEIGAVFSVVSKTAAAAIEFNGNILQISNNGTTGDAGEVVIKAEFEGLSVTKTIAITDSTVPQASVSVVKANLINADTSTVIREITNNSTIDLNTLPTRNLNIEFITNPSKIGSLVIVGMGKNVTESGAPYTWGGDNPPRYNGAVFPVGQQTITATPYSGSGATGTTGTPMVLNFTVTDSKIVAPVSNYKIYGYLDSTLQHSRAVINAKFGATPPIYDANNDDLREGSSTVVNPATGKSPAGTFSPTRAASFMASRQNAEIIQLDWEKAPIQDNFEKSDPAKYNLTKSEFIKMCQWFKTNYPHIKITIYNMPKKAHYASQFSYNLLLNETGDARWAKMDGLVELTDIISTPIYNSFAEEDGQLLFGAVNPVKNYSSSNPEHVRLRGRAGNLAYMEANLNFGLEMKARYNKPYMPIFSHFLNDGGIDRDPSTSGTLYPNRYKLIQSETISDYIVHAFRHRHPTLKTGIDAAGMWYWGSYTGTGVTSRINHKGGMPIYGSRSSITDYDGTPWIAKQTPANWDTLTLDQRKALGPQMALAFDQQVWANTLNLVAQKLGI